MKYTTRQKSLLGGSLLVAATCLAAWVSADNWPQWRGLDGFGHSKERNLPVTWSATENVKWKTPLPGPGMSSPIVWKDKVFLTQSLDKAGTRRALICFDRKSGKEHWQRVTEFSGKESTYDPEPHFCSASPVTDGERVVAFFASAGMVCYDLNGNELWRRDLGPCDQIWGTAASPIIYKNLVIHNFGPGERTFLIALDKRTGKDVWKVDIPGGSFGKEPSNWNGSWATPVVAKVNGRDELIAPWPKVLKAYDPATGKELWSCQGLTPLSYTSPLVSGDVVAQLCGFGGSALAVKAGGTGDVTESNRLWHVEKSTQRIGSGVVVGEHLYFPNENGIINCVELKTGKTLWAERAAGQTWSSMVYGDGRIYLTNQRGETVVIAAKPVFEVLSRNPLNERSQSSPAISDGDIFIRTYNHLWCIGQKK